MVLPQLQCLDVENVHYFTDDLAAQTLSGLALRTTWVKVEGLGLPFYLCETLQKINAWEKNCLFPLLKTSNYTETYT